MASSRLVLVAVTLTGVVGLKLFDGKIIVMSAEGIKISRMPSTSKMRMMKVSTYAIPRAFRGRTGGLLVAGGGTVLERPLAGGCFAIAGMGLAVGVPIAVRD